MITEIMRNLINTLLKERYDVSISFKETDLSYSSLISVNKNEKDYLIKIIVNKFDNYGKDYDTVLIKCITDINEKENFFKIRYAHLNDINFISYSSKVENGLSTFEYEVDNDEEETIEEGKEIIESSKEIISIVSKFYTLM
ncbi:hypothetical protein FDB39_16990 [Clostridium botulinum]|nr:hypothetical protein [Clostridium botulinum]